MAVQILNDSDKRFIATAYTHSNVPLAQLAKNYGVSRRTIGRVLEEFSLHTPVPRLQSEAAAVMKLLKRFNVDPDRLESILENDLVSRQITKWHSHKGNQGTKIPALLLASPSFSVV